VEEKIHRPKWEFSKSKEEIFRELIQDARRFWPDLPDTQERMDPVLKILFGAFACQFESLYSSLNETSEQIFEAMARHMYYDALRSPTPAVTILRFDPTDPGIEIDELTSLIYTEERGREKRPYYFSPVARSHLVQATPAKLFLLKEEGLSDLSPRIQEKGLESKNPQFISIPKETCNEFCGGRKVLYLGLKTTEGLDVLPDFNLFFDAPEKTLAFLRWGEWIPSDTEGIFSPDGRGVPGKAIFDLTWHVKNPPLIPHHRSPEDFLSDFEEYFFPVRGLVPSYTPRDLQQLLGEKNEEVLESEESLAWLKVILPPEATEGSLLEIRGIHPNCIPAVNLFHQTHTHVTQGLPLVEMTLPDPLTKVYRIDEVRDSEGRVYENRLNASDLQSPLLYSIREDGERPCIVLYFDKDQNVPERVQITYSITEGEEANKIEPGLITDLYDKRRHPGIENVTNITRSAGGQSAPTREDLLRGFTHLLRNHSRGITSRDLEDLTLSFDLRIQKAVCEPGVDRGPKGARRCINMRISVGESAFPTQGEKEIFSKRLQTYLKERSPINTAVNLIIN
jgi:hypothetical protein